MSEQTPRPVGNVDVGSSPRANLSKLTELARQAYEQRRTKDCLDQTRAILLIDPDNAEAQRMRASVRSEMNHDLTKARVLLGDVQPQKERRETESTAAYMSFRQARYADPVAEAAPAVLSDAQLQPPSRAPVAPAVPITGEPSSIEPTVERFFDPPVRTRKRKRSKGLMRASVIVLFGVVVAGLPKLRSNSNPMEVPPSLAASEVSTPTPQITAGDRPQDTDRTSPAVLAVVTPISTAFITNKGTSPRSTSPSTSAASVHVRDVAAPGEPITLASGTLAISSPTATEIYIGNQYVGAAPVSLQMSAGTHTVEYRHGDLRKTLTHVVASNETTKATITFDVSVSINAKPWADVFLDGIERKPLGQTPLSGVRVPIGGVLVFENSQFEGKKYRVTGKETGIQVVFP